MPAIVQKIEDMGIDFLFVIGGNGSHAGALAIDKLCREKGLTTSVIGVPKTIDNDVFPIRQSLGAWTAAEQGAKFFENVVAGARHAACAAAPRHACAPPHTPHTPHAPHAPHAPHTPPMPPPSAPAQSLRPTRA